jgi:hypothetical protein
MALFKDITAFKKYVEATLSLNFEDVLPSIDYIESHVIKNLISDAQYTALNAAFSAAASETSLSANDLNLLKAVRLALANYAIAMAIPRLQIQVSSSGTHIMSDDRKKTAFPWQIKQAVDSYLDAGDGGADDLLDFLETNKATYTIWAASSSYTIFKDCFVNTTAIFNSIRPINNSRRIFLLLKPTMKLVQDKQLLGTIGKDYYDELLAEVFAGTISPDNVYPLSLVRNAVTYITCAIALYELAIRIDRDGVTITASRNTDEPQVKNAVDNKALSPIAKNWMEAGEGYLRTLSDYLNKNATASMFATYFNSDKYRDPTLDEGRYTNDSNYGVGLF